MKYILSILLIAVSLLAFSQEATIKRVEVTNSIAASKYPMTDLNGHTAALVIVQTIVENVEFLGSVLNGGVVHKTGEYWVYMGVGAKELHIHSNKFIPVEIRFPDYGIPRLETATTYVVTLTLPPTSAQPQSAAAGYNYLVLNVSPANAQVIINGKPTDVQDGGVAKRLLRGGATYSYRVEASGYLPEEGSITMKGQKVELNVTLRSTKGLLAVTTATSGTEIYVNGDSVGVGSWNGELQPGDYLIEGRLASHRTVETLVSIATGESLTVPLPALAAITGALNVDYLPAGAAITIDGVAHGTTPNIIEGLLIGPHSISIVAPGYVPSTFTASIKESDLTTIEGHLEQSNFSTTPVHLSLCAARHNGQIVYITAGEWRMLSPSDRSSYTPKGVCLSENGVSFLINLFDTENEATKETALRYNLPNKWNGEIIAKNYKSLNEALNVFGGNEMKELFYWIRNGSSFIGCFLNMYDGRIFNDYKIYRAPVREISSIYKYSEIPTLTNTEISSISLKPIHLALCATGFDGIDAYITADQWQSLSSNTRSYYTPKGVCLQVDGELFIVELHDASKWMFHYDALNYQLPTKTQAQILAQNKDLINSALQAYGGTIMKSTYWTNCESNSSCYTLDMVKGNITEHSKRELFDVRAVITLNTGD